MLKTSIVTSALTLAACTYDTTFHDCTIHCSSEGCPTGLACGVEGLCREPGVTAACSSILSDAGSDAGVLSNMELIPAGPFMMGSPSGIGSADEEPLHEVTLLAYYIDRYEVTNAEWNVCVTGGGCMPPANSSSATRSGYYNDPTYNDYPVIWIDWNQAAAYCNWMNKRLPTEAEWEKAARGSADARTYPWGEAAPTCTLENDNYCVGDTAAVGATSPGGDSPYTVAELAGNVAEWVADWYAADFYSSCASGCSNPTGPVNGTTRVVRGGCWGCPTIDSRNARRTDFDPLTQRNDVGLRCARGS